jgi:hypothetical protein
MKGRITSLHWMTAYGFVPLVHHGTVIRTDTVVPYFSEISREPVVLFRRVLRERDRAPWPPPSLPRVGKTTDLLALQHRTLDDLSYLLGFDDFE